MTVFNASLLSMGVQNELKPFSMVIVLKYTVVIPLWSLHKNLAKNLGNSKGLEIHYGRFWDFWSENCMGVKTNEMGCFYLPNHCYQP